MTFNSSISEYTRCSMTLNIWWICTQPNLQVTNFQHISLFLCLHMSKRFHWCKIEIDSIKLNEMEPGFIFHSDVLPCVSLGYITHLLNHLSVVFSWPEIFRASIRSLVICLTLTWKDICLCFKSFWHNSLSQNRTHSAKRPLSHSLCRIICF